MREKPLHNQIEQRFGILPNFFKLASDTPEVTENLWGFAQFAYLDSPLPSLFKERLFVYLSRFCEVRYCIARHIGFLVGLGYLAGDRDCLAQTVEQVLPLLQRPLLRGEELEPALALCNAYDSSRFEYPNPDTAEEGAIFACATHLFLQTPDAPRASVALRQVLGAARLEFLNVFLAFVRMAHYWTQLHPELCFEDDINHLLAADETLANCLLNEPEVEDNTLSQRVLEELAELRQLKQQHESIVQSYEVVSRELQACFRSVFSNNMVAMGIWTGAGDITEANDALLDLIGYTRLELEAGSIHWTELTPPEYHDRDQQAIAEVMADGACTPYEKEFIHKDGHQIPITIGGGDFDAQNGAGVFFALDLTERKLAEALLKASHDTFRHLVENSPFGLYVVDADFRLAQVSVGAQKIFENVRPLIGRDFAEAKHVIWSEPFASEAIARFRHTLETGEPYHAPSTTERRHDIDEVESYDWKIERITLPDGRFGVVCHFYDLSERQRYEAALRGGEERFRNMADSSPVLIWQTDETGVTFVNRYYLEFFAQTLDDLKGMGWANFLHPDDAAAYLQAYRAAFERQERYEFQCRFLRHDGEYRWLQSIGEPHYGLDHTFLGFVGCSVDVTDIKVVEAELQASEERFRNMADNAPMMVWVTNTTGYCTYLSRSWYDFTGQSEETGLGFGWLDATHPDDRESSQALFLAANERQEAFQLEYRLRHRDGSYRTCIDAAKPWFGLDGEFKGYIGSVIDIDERQKAEAEREQLLVREQASREAAEAANRIKDEFLAVLSHELRSPLNPILGWATLLKTGQFEQETVERGLEIIERNATLQTQLIEDLLDVSRILRGKLSLNQVPVDLSAVISSALETVRLAAEAKSLALRFRNQQPQIQVLGDAGRLQQVVWNLLANAVKFTPQGGQIAVTLTSTATSAQLQVSDTGKGINPDFLPYVFEHFRQEDGATTRKFGGLGLGLAIVRQIVELHGGAVAVESQGEGQGATFTLKLPLLKSRDSGVEMRKKPDSVSLPTAHCPLTGLQILVVDDEADSREFVAFVLEQAGALVTTVASGIEALQTFSQSVPHLIVSDIGMPEMDGYLLMRQIRTLPLEQGKQIPAIALTAYAGELNQQQALAAGFQRHLAKPIAPETVVALVIELVSSA